MGRYSYVLIADVSAEDVAPVLGAVNQPLGASDFYRVDTDVVAQLVEDDFGDGQTGQTPRQTPRPTCPARTALPHRAGRTRSTRWTASSGSGSRGSARTSPTTPT